MLIIRVNCTFALIILCRDKLLESLSEYIAVDVYGKCGNLTCEKKIVNDNNKVLEPIISLNEMNPSVWAIIRSPCNLKFFFAGIPQGPSETSPGTIEIIQKRVQGPPARGF